MKELLKNLIAHTKSSRFVVIVLVLMLSFVGAIINMIWEAFPYLAFAGIINSLSLGTWILKTFEPGARERRLNGRKNPGELPGASK